MRYGPDFMRENSIPKGVADFLPEQADKINSIEGKICNVFELWGFRRIIPPMLEFEDVLAAGMDDDLRGRSFRFEDRQSARLLAIPPDITPQIARIVGMRMSGCPLPYRLFYTGRVLRHVESQLGHSREMYQAGVELIGLDSPEADAEMIAMAVEILQNLGIEGFKVDLGQVDFFKGIMASARLSKEVETDLQQAIARKDSSAVAQLLENEPVADSVKGEIAALPRMFGGIELLETAGRMVRNDRSRRALDNLAQVIDILSIHGISEQLTIDLGEIRGLAYHTGVTFEGFVPGIGEPVCGGGRYDGLMERYGASMPATGFAFNVLKLLHGLEKHPDSEVGTAMDLLIFNQLADRRDALALATELRRQGLSVARDIIRRDFEQSLAYARRMNIRHMLVIGERAGDANEVDLVRVDDTARQRMTMDHLMKHGRELLR
jgi:ATP phosphoribosyltransferase regulatory subunit